MKRLDPVRRACAKEIFYVFYLVSLEEKRNFMHSTNLATIFGGMVDIVSNIMNQSYESDTLPLLTSLPPVTRRPCAGLLLRTTLQFLGTWTSSQPFPTANPLRARSSSVRHPLYSHSPFSPLPQPPRFISSTARPSRFKSLPRPRWRTWPSRFAPNFLSDLFFSSLFLLL